MPNKIEEIVIDTEESEEYLPGHSVDDPESNIVVFFTFQWMHKCSIPNENVRGILKQMYQARTGPIENAEHNEWYVGLDI